MKDPFDNLLDRLARSTRSPQGKYSAENSWKILEERIFAHARRQRRFRLWLTGAAATVLLCIAGWTAYEALRPVPMQTFSTLAEVRNLTLPDGTEVTLNRYSSLTCPKRFEHDRRDVRLQGEAYFEVSKDARRPFTVEAGGMEVQVLGTHFNVEAYPADTEVRTTLLEGSVAVSTDHGKKRLLLQPNEAAVYNRHTGLLRQGSHSGGRRRDSLEPRTLPLPPTDVAGDRTTAIQRLPHAHPHRRCATGYLSPHCHLQQR